MNRIGIALVIPALITWSASSSAQTAQGFAVNRFDPVRARERVVRGGLARSPRQRPARGRRRGSTGPTSHSSSTTPTGLEHGAAPREPGRPPPRREPRPVGPLRGSGWTSPSRSWTAAAAGRSTASAYVSERRGEHGRRAPLARTCASSAKFDDAFTLAGGVAVYLPSGSRADFTGDGTVRVEPRLLAAGRIGSLLRLRRACSGSTSALSADSSRGTSLGSEVVFASPRG